MTILTYESAAPGVTLIKLDDGKANAISPAFVEELSAALDRAEGDGTKAIVLAGREGRFCAGFDLKVLMGGGLDAARALFSGGAELMMKMYGHPLPIVCAVTGHALAGGALVTAVCDRRIGARGDFKIGLNEVAIGLPLPVFAIGIAEARLDPRALSAATLEATIYRPDDAVTVGWLDEVVEPDQLMARATEEAKRLAALSGPSFAGSKKNLRARTIAHVLETLEADLAGIEVKMSGR